MKQLFIDSFTRQSLEFSLKLRTKKENNGRQDNKGLSGFLPSNFNE